MARAKYQQVASSEEAALFVGNDGKDMAFDDIENQQRLRSNFLSRMKRTKFLVILFSFVFLTVTTVGVFWRWPLPGKPHTPALSLEELRNGTYAQRLQPITWLENGENGQVVAKTADGYQISYWPSQNNSKLVAPLSFNASGDTHTIDTFTLNKQQTYALVTTGTQKHWRHSSFAKYWVLDISTQHFQPLNENLVSTASWSPNGESIAYVLDHNIFVYTIPKKSTHQVTFDGGEDIFNGIPDWVYEEEVFAGDSAIWWSPKSQYIAYMRTNDSLVPKFPIPYFLGSASKRPAESPEAYPDLVEIKYPKPGSPNPKVELWLYDISGDGSPNFIDIPTSLQEPIISEVIWVAEQAVVKMMNRESDSLEVWIVDPAANSIQLSRSYSSADLGGSWFEVTHNSHAVGTEGYIDTIDVNGYNHLGYFTPANSSNPVVLTSGEWEVQDTAIAVNLKTRHVYFHATKRASTESTLYRVSLDNPGGEPELVGFQGKGVYSASFSGDATFATVTYSAPTEPLIQKVVKLSNHLVAPSAEDQKTNKEATEWILEDNKDLRNLLDSRKLTSDENVIYGTVDVGNGIEVNYREIRPTSFNPKKKHPLLFYNYGGPGSQQVQERLTLDFQRVFAEKHNAVVVTVDPRGTGNRGRQFRAVVRDHLGDFEADDVISVAKIWNKKNYIDSDTTAIWGWSYGGFLTLKTLERDHDLAFKYGVAVAPVTDWRLYDSIYTERYMHKPDNNEHYATSAISNVTNIGAHKRFLIMHGTGDDNVHFQNTLTLLDKFDLAGIENYDVHVFPDSDHSISFHNANKIVYDKVDQWLEAQQ